MCLADFEDYCRVHNLVTDAYKDQGRWNAMSAINIAGAEYFAADRSIKDYANGIWRMKPLN